MTALTSPEDSRMASIARAGIVRGRYTVTHGVLCLRRHGARRHGLVRAVAHGACHLVGRIARVVEQCRLLLGARSDLAHGAGDLVHDPPGLFGDRGELLGGDRQSLARDLDPADKRARARRHRIERVADPADLVACADCCPRPQISIGRVACGGQQPSERPGDRARDEQAGDDREQRGEHGGDQDRDGSGRRGRVDRGGLLVGLGLDGHVEIGELLGQILDRGHERSGVHRARSNAVIRVFFRLVAGERDGLQQVRRVGARAIAKAE